MIASSCCTIVSAVSLIVGITLLATLCTTVLEPNLSRREKNIFIFISKGSSYLANIMLCTIRYVLIKLAN